jgi:hypothetical protein
MVKTPVPHKLLCSLLLQPVFVVSTGYKLLFIFYLFIFVLGCIFFKFNHFTKYFGIHRLCFQVMAIHSGSSETICITLHTHILQVTVFTGFWTLERKCYIKNKF